MLKFNQFTKAILENSGSTQIPKDAYVYDARFQNEDDLIKNLEENLAPSFLNFAKKFNIPIVNPKFSVYPKNGNLYISLESDNLPNDMLGVLKHVLKEVHFTLFSGREVKYKKDYQFEFKPYIWSTLNLTWVGNGGNYYYQSEHSNPDIARRSDVYYNIVTGEWLSYAEYFADEIGALSSEKLYNNNKKHGVFDA